MIGPNIIFHGANIHIVADSITPVDAPPKGGLGNLIIGTDDLPNRGLQPGDRSGTSNLIVGRGHKFTAQAFLGVLFGEGNELTDQGDILGGGNNSVDAELGVVVGGSNNDVSASGVEGVLVGGKGNESTGFFTVVLGGGGNDADGPESVVVGGGA